jgi:hypothetical protein
LGLTEVVTLVAPRLFRFPPTFHPITRKPGVMGTPDLRREDQPKLTDCLRENVPDSPDQRFLENSA